jgi:hypothetical protein
MLLEEAVAAFEAITQNVASHKNVLDEDVYPQPSVYLVSHLVCMRAAGWRDISFDTLAAVSGASALFAYEPGTFMPKYANLYIGMDERIAEATGFGWEWVPFDGAEEAWTVLKRGVDAGRPLKGGHAENVVFVGYQSATTPEERQVFAMTDGPEYYAKWWTWDEFEQWIADWSQNQLGRHTTLLIQSAPRAIVLRVLRDLVDWAEAPPDAVKQRYPNAKFGLEGIEAYAEDCADMEAFDDWHACHGINPQWTVRNSTAVYLDDVAETKIFSEPINAHLREAAVHYRDAYDAWREFYEQLGHGAPEGAGTMKSRRLAGAAAVREALAHEKAGIATLQKVLSAVNT